MGLPLYELRVLAGPQEGASLALKPGVTVDVGSLSAGGCQVVLRDPRVSEQRVRLHVRSGDVRLEVLAGAVDMAGRRLVAPCVADWPCFVPVRIGDTVLAVGDTEAGDGPWSRALSLAMAPAAPFDGQDSDVSATAASPGEGGDSAPPPEEAPTRRRMETWLAVGGGVITVAAIGLLAFVSAISPGKASAEPPAQRLAKVLQAPAFAGLRMEDDKDHRLHVRGDLLTLAQRAELDRGLAAAAIDASVEVRVGEQLASAVREVYRMNGVVAETDIPATLADIGQVRVRTKERDVAHLQQVEATARRDVPGLVVLLAENTPPEVMPDPTPVIDDPGKRVASIVPGPTPYVVTVDGTRYFVGALLPSGHRLASISEQEVILDKDGKLSPLRF